MKNKTLALITAALITAAALVLTAGLSLLSGSAINGETLLESFAESIADDGVIGDGVQIEVNTEDVNDVLINNDVDEEIYVDANPEPEENAPVEDDTVVEDEPAVEDEPVTEDEPFVPGTDAYGNPIFAPSVEWKGGELAEDHSAPYFIDDVVVQIYEHATGKLVSQKIFLDDQIWEDINQLHLDIYQKGNHVYDPSDKDAVPIAIPNGKYRVEVYAIWYANNSGCGSLFFAYTYGTNELIEMWKNGDIYSGTQDFIAYVDALIADEMALVEAGNGNVPALEDDVTYICGFGAEKVSWTAFKWTGDYHKTFKANRGTERFPYIEK